MALTPYPKPSKLSEIWESIKGPLTPITTAILGGIGWLVLRIHGRMLARSKRKADGEKTWRFFIGLPLEAKAVLVNFHDENTHTMRWNTNFPPIQLLLHDGILSMKTGGGTYDAVDRYFSVRSDIWEVMDWWKVREPTDIAAARDYSQKVLKRLR